MSYELFWVCSESCLHHLLASSEACPLWMLNCDDEWILIRGGPLLSTRWRWGGGAYHGQYIFPACVGKRADNEAKIAPKSIGGLAWRGEVSDQGIYQLPSHNCMYSGLSLLVVTTTFHDLSTREKYLREIIKLLHWPNPLKDGWIKLHRNGFRNGHCFENSTRLNPQT